MTDSHDERVRKPGDRICKLDAELTVVVVKPAARNHSDAIGTSNACLSKETSKDVANNTTNGMRREDLM